VVSHIPRLFSISSLLLVVWGVAVAAEDSSTAQCTATGTELANLMEKTKVAVVTNYTGPPSEFRSDGNVDTLELVLLPKKKGVVSSASEDGEVIFLVGKVKDADQSRLIEMAFCLRARTRRA
jgi:hypothetical protein